MPLYYEKLVEETNTKENTCSVHVYVWLYIIVVLAGNFKRKLQAIISDAPYKYYGLSEIMACNFHLKLLASTIHVYIQYCSEGQQFFFYYNNKIRYLCLISLWLDHGWIMYTNKYSEEPLLNRKCKCTCIVYGYVWMSINNLLIVQHKQTQACLIF